MRISEHSTNDVTILDLLMPKSGDFSHQLFVPQVESMIEEGKTRFVFNLADLAWINSTAIGLLVGARRKVEEAGGRVVLASVNDRIKGILQVVGLLAIWEVYEDVPAAISSFHAGNGVEAEGSAS